MSGKRTQQMEVLDALARFADCGDGPGDYERLALEIPELWPLEVVDADGRSLAWHADAKPLFLVFRDALRRVWVHERKAKREGVPDLLLGLAQLFALPGPLYAAKSFPGLGRAIDHLMATHPGATASARAGLRVNWSSGGLIYADGTQFGNAVWSLMKQPWRSRVCPECEKFYVARKIAQRYCGAECQHDARKRQFREAWARSATKRRAAKRQPARIEAKGLGEI
jgi:hypothetical protein